MRELTPRKLDFGYGGHKVVGEDQRFNRYLAHRRANFRTAQAEVYKGNSYVWGFRVAGRLILTTGNNYPLKIR